MSAVLAPRFQARPMTERALADVDAIERAIYDFPWTIGNFRDSLRAGYACFTFHETDPVLGYAVLMFAVDEAHLLNLSIDAARQGQGFGRAALEYLIEHARHLGATRMLLEVRPSNAVARGLYDKRGFRQVGLRRGYYPAHGGREDAIVLALPL
jgi:ribosomal-protein-alanine N-acetyltransferase